MACISHITDKVIFGDQTDIGTETISYTKDLGIIQKMSVNESENFEQVEQVGSSFTSSSNELGLYNITGQIETLLTKSSIPEFLELVMGTRTDATDYTVINSTDVKFISAKMEYTPTTVLQIIGIHLTNISIDISKDGNFIATSDYNAKVMTEETETITPNLNTEKLFKGLDISATYGGTALIINSLSLNADWNYSIDDGRGVELVTTGERRQIQRACKHNLTLTGNLDAEVEAGFEIGYEDEKTDSDLVITISRGTDNAHIITLTGCQLDNKEFESNTDNSVKNLSSDIIAINYSVTGDL